MARVHHVKSCRKAQGECGKCGKKIKKGDGYRHASPGFRGTKRIRCLDSKCSFRSSDLTTSKWSDALAAQEQASDDLAALDGKADESSFQSIAEDCAQNLEAVGDEYQESLDGMVSQEGDIAENIQERIDNLEACRDEVSGLEFPSFTEYKENEDADAEEDDWRQSLSDRLTDAIDSLEEP